MPEIRAQQFAADGRVRPGLKWSSQHLERRLRWPFGSGVRIGPGEAPCPRLVGPLLHGVRITVTSGLPSRRDARVRTLRWGPGSRQPWGHAGSGGRAACHHPISRRRRSRCQGVLCRLPSGRKSRSGARNGTGCARSPAGSRARRPRSPASCAATISRELRGNAATRSGGLAYRATTAQWHADRSARRPKSAKLAINAPLRRYVQDRLAGVIIAPNGAAVRGPVVPWKGRRHGRRQDRRWATAWSPEQIARRLRLDFPEDETMRISHEAIYQALYVQGRGALRRELTACLRTGRALRVPRARSRGRGKSCIAPEILISQRPAQADDRAGPGHWEGDLILGLGSSAIGTLVERTT